MKKIIIPSIIIILVIGVMMIKKENKKTPAEVIAETEISETSVPEVKVETPVQEKNSELKEELNEYLKELPTMGELKNLSEEEVHHTPTMIKDGGAILGKIHAAAEKNPERREDTLKFFKECAEDEEVVTALRAVCWNKVMTLIPEWQIFLSISDAQVSEEVKSLASQL